ncbi:hypothetical protein ACHAXA_006730 [Cyclostephanos tholiformis]|uniref:Uncharacterized protein n=1 Tax=Cyclostephanos tholiformis TaxID=382380 RepID=A0ABD3SRW7_9STRA
MASPKNDDIQRAKDFVVRVKCALGASSSDYRNFLHTLRMYKSGELSPTDVIDRMSSLFSGVEDLIREELIAGFDAFLPSEYRINGRGGRVDIGGVGVANDVHGKVDEEKEDESNKGVKHDVKCAGEKRIVDDDPDAGGQNEDGEDEDDNSDHLGTKRPRRTKRSRPLLGDDCCASFSSSSAAASASRIKITRADIILSPPFVDPSCDLLHGGCNPVQIVNRNRRDIDGSSVPEQQRQQQQQQQQQQRADDYYEGIAVECKLCNGKRDAMAIANNEPVLLCEQRGCNAEYHLGCLYNCRPRLFRTNNNSYNNEKKVGAGATKLKSNDTVWDTEDVASSVSDGLDDDGDDRVDAPTSKIDGVDNSCTKYLFTELEIPTGEIYCAECHSMGAASVLAKYFDRVDYERSHFSCNRAYVTALLEKHMTDNPEGNVIGGKGNDGWGTAIARSQFKNMPRSELWDAHELHRLAMSSSDSTTAGRSNNGNGKENPGCEGVCDGDDDLNSIEWKKAVEDDGEDSAEFLVGKVVTIYNYLDNEYHVGRIVDWRTSTAYPFRPTPPGIATCNRKKNGSIRIEDLYYYGTGSLSTCEFLVRFPSGTQGRKKELLRWIMLEEHSLAVGVSLIQGKASKPNGDGGIWKPATILARSALELVLIRPLLCEDEQGNLFGTMIRSEKSGFGGDEGTKGGSNVNDEKWALASFFGESQHALLHLPYDARSLLEHKRAKQIEEGENDVPTLFRNRWASVDIPLALALAEQSERERCKAWSRLILHRSDHPLALLSFDEYCAQRQLEKCRFPSANVDGASESGLDETPSIANGSDRSLVERGLDRMWLAQLREKVSSSCKQQPMQLSKDMLMSFKCENVSSVANAMALLQSR